ncbi:hypothetical protein F5Y02DRAFT_163537 [Annulohypoxylon stygium]|nr:hypothetical protein F5Y02DRAFT_163537 [Annulohypoxylon stygium]
MRFRTNPFPLAFFIRGVFGSRDATNVASFGPMSLRAMSKTLGASKMELFSTLLTHTPQGIACNLEERRHYVMKRKHYVSIY